MMSTLQLQPSCASCKRSSRNGLVALLMLLLISAAAATGSNNIAKALIDQSRRILNFGNIMGSPQSISGSPYDRILGHACFQVTTAWGSTYMNMERLTDMEETGSTGQPENILNNKNPNTLKSISEEQNDYRTVALYYMDPDDAIAAHAELKQMEQMKEADIRVTSVSLGKALRSAANLGDGLVTGYPVEALTGKLKSVEEGGSLRHKVVPPKRQLFYAARCIGKERVGFFGDNPSEEATAAVLGNSALETMNLVARRDKRERKTPKSKTLIQAQNSHMEGYTGIPVFYAHGMERRYNPIKGILSGNRRETPMFLNYEDLQDAWAKMKQRKKTIPDQPTVEVFNLWDVLTSMEKEGWKKKQSSSKKDTLTAPIERRVGKLGEPDLNSITFVPSSRSTTYKEIISARGNGKARLRPMR